MKKAKYVAVGESLGRFGLEKVGDRLVKLEEVCGKITFAEVKPTGYGSCLTLKIENCPQEVWWQEQSRMPMNASVGQRLRGFYNGTSNSNKVICLEAYELLDSKENVLSRASKLGQFVGGRENAA